MTDEGCTGVGRGRGHTYTEAEVKVLTETASKVAYTLGRKDAGEGNQRELLVDLGDIARDIASSPSGATWDARSGVPAHSAVSEAPRSLDLDRVIAVKWGDKTIDPSEVVYVLREAK